MTSVILPGKIKRKLVFGTKDLEGMLIRDFINYLFLICKISASLKFLFPVSVVL